MLQTQPDSPSIPASHQGIKQRKKQAKREAKIMLALEQAKKDVEQAEKKLATAQGNLEHRQARLHKFEAQLSALREVNNGALPESKQNEASS